MRGPLVPGRRDGGFAVLPAVLCCCVLWAWWPATVAAKPARTCEPMSVGGFAAPETPPPPPERVDHGLVPVTLPVVVHYMRPEGSPHDVARKVRPQTLIEYFEESGTINAIWRQAGVRLYLLRFERCTFTFADFGLATNVNEEVDSPARSTAGKTRFRRINETFNATDVKAVDLYVWRGINQDGGYGDRWLDTGAHRAGGAWIDTDCLENDHVDCDLLLAHEIGHFLGLCHSCTIGQPLPKVACTRCLPTSMKQEDRSFTLANCVRVRHRTRIMRSDNLKLFLPYRVTGSELNRCERRLANSFASQRAATTSNLEGGERHGRWWNGQAAGQREARGDDRVQGAGDAGERREVHAGSPCVAEEVQVEDHLRLDRPERRVGLEADDDGTGA